MTAHEGAASFTLPTIDFNRAIDAHARHRCHQPAFIDDGQVLTWGQFSDRVAKVAEALARAGVRKGDRVALLAANSFWAYETMFGIARAGAIITPLSTLQPPTLQAKLLSDCGARLLLAGRGYEELAAQSVALLDPRPSLATESEEVDGAVSLERLAADSTDDFRGVARDPQDTFTIIYSSGTTGVPKGIMHSIAGRLGLAWQFGTALGVTAQARSLVATPPSSNGSMILLLPTLYAGGACILQRTLAPDDFLRALNEHGMTHAFLVPTQFRSIFDDPRVAQADFGSVRCLLSVGAPMPAELKQRVLRSAGNCFHEAWGFTEGVATVIYPSEVERRPESVGRPLPGTELRLIDAKGHLAGAPGSGEIIGRSTMMMQGYLNRPDANSEIRWIDADGTVFLRTGDIGEIDSHGFLTLRGRIKDMIISGGLNVYPVDIESALLQHPGVLDAAVIGVPDEHWGEVPVAFVTARDGLPTDPVSMKSWINDRVAKHQRVAELIVRTTDFPRNALGKVLKGELRSAYVKAP